jgi:hypothetical protein
MGAYELGLAMPPGSLDVPTRLKLLRALWDDPLLAGVVCDEQEFGEPWRTLDAEVANKHSLYGCLRIGERLVGCYTLFLDLPLEAWCVLCVPMSLIEQVYPVRYGPEFIEMSEANNPWQRAELHPLLAKIAARVYDKTPFELGILGWLATDDNIEIAKLTPQFLMRTDMYTDLVVPTALFARVGVRPHGLQLGDELWWTGGVG